jgi:hypothetical protein
MKQIIATLKEDIYIPDEDGYIDGCAELLEVGEAVCESELEELAKKFIEAVKGNGRHYPKGSKFNLVDYDGRRKIWEVEKKDSGNDDDYDEDDEYCIWDTKENRDKYFV